MKISFPFSFIDQGDSGEVIQWRIRSLRNTRLRTVGLRLEFQETKRLPIIKPPLDFLGFEVPQPLFIKNWTDTSGDLCVAR